MKYSQKAISKLCIFQCFHEGKVEYIIMCRKLIYLFCFILALSPVLTNAAEGTDPCLVGWWRFDEGSGGIAYDRSGNENNGTLNGNPQWVARKTGGALAFDGKDDYVDCSNDASLDITDKVTIAVWVKTNDAGNRQYNPYITKGDHSYAIKHHISNSIEFCIFDRDWHIVHFPVDGSFNNVWHHLAGTYDGTNLKLYIDGTLEVTTAYTGSIANSVFSVNIGRNTQETGRFYKGAIDDVRIYNRALTQDEIAAIYADKTTGKITSNIPDVEIARNPGKILQRAYKQLQQFGNWRTDFTVRSEHAKEIASMLLVITRTKQIKGNPIKEILYDYYEITKQLPDTPQAIISLCELVTMDKQNGWGYAVDFLAKDVRGTKAAQFYGTLIKKYMIDANYADVEKHVKLFVDKYNSASNGLELVDQLMSSIGSLRNREDLREIIERNVLQNPDSEICCAVFGHRALELSGAKKFDQVLELARWAQTKFPETKLALCAMAALADNQYKQGNYISALLAFKPKFLTRDRPESEIIKDIDSTLTLYKANTLQTQGIDSGKVYEVLAKYSFGLGWNAVAVHCYSKSARIKGFNLQTFEDAASETTKYSNSAPDAEVWFWKGLFAAEEDDLMTAAMTYKRFLKTDTTSILAARAYYDTARARMALGQYSEARDAIAETKRISPCEPINQLERELNNSTNHLRGGGI